MDTSYATEQDYRISCCERCKFAATRMIYSRMCWSLQIFMLLACVVMLIWDVLRQHIFGIYVQHLDALYVFLDYFLCGMLIVEVIIRGIAAQSKFFKECFNYLDIAVIVVLVVTNIVMHTRLDRLLGRKKSRDLWLISVYAVRYMAQIARMLMMWNEQRLNAEIQKAGDEYEVSMPPIDSEGSPLGKQGSSIQGNGFPGYQSFGHKISRPEKLHISMPQWRHRSPKKDSYERRKQENDSLAVAFDVTPLDSPSGDGWAEVLSPRQNLDD